MEGLEAQGWEAQSWPGDFLEVFMRKISIRVWSARTSGLHLFAQDPLDWLPLKSMLMFGVFCLWVFDKHMADSKRY